VEASEICLSEDLLLVELAMRRMSCLSDAKSIPINMHHSQAQHSRR
jgi:hypothetical protein